MDRLQYNILLEEAGIFERRKLDKDEVFDKGSDFIYTETNTKDIYEIIPNDLTTEEIKVVLLAKQVNKLNSLHSTVMFITVIIFLPVLFSLIFLFLR